METICTVCFCETGCVCGRDDITNAALPTPAAALPLLAQDREYVTDWFLARWNNELQGEGAFWARRRVGRSYTGSGVHYVADFIEYEAPYAGRTALVTESTTRAQKLGLTAARDEGALVRPDADERASLRQLGTHPCMLGADAVLLNDLP